MKNYAKFLFLFAILASCASAYDLAVKVTITQDTAAVGTNVSLVTGGVELSMQRADAAGFVHFNATPGSYFVLLRRGGYPLHVSLVEVAGNTNVTLTMRQLVSYANAYGQVSGPYNFSNSTVTAYSGGLLAKRVLVNKDGFYVLSYIPEGTYELKFDSPGFEQKTVSEFLPTADFVEVNAKLSQAVPPKEIPAAISSPAQVQQSSIIEVRLTKGAIPLPGELITAETPSGKITITTDSNGVARVNAAESGNYNFIYGKLNSATFVPAKTPMPGSDRDSHGCIGSAGYTWCEAAQKCIRSWEEGCTAPAQPPATPEQPPAPQQDSGGSNTVAVALLVLFAVVISFLVLIFAAKMFLPAIRRAFSPRHQDGRHRHAAHRHHKK